MGYSSNNRTYTLIDSIFKLLLMISWISLLISGASALAYELYAVITMRLPVISHLAEVWIRAHKLAASGIAAIVLAFIIWLLIHWYVIPNDLIKH